MRVRQVFTALIALAALTACTPEEVNLWLAASEPHAHNADGDAVNAMIRCESGGVPSAISSTGKYRGLGQFDQRTWDSVASRHFPWLIGADPASVDAGWQRSMILALIGERGASPWPNCGRYLYR